MPRRPAGIPATCIEGVVVDLNIRRHFTSHGLQLV